MKCNTGCGRDAVGVLVITEPGKPEERFHNCEICAEDSVESNQAFRDSNDCGSDDVLEVHEFLLFTDFHFHVPAVCQLCKVKPVAGTLTFFYPDWTTEVSHFVCKDCGERKTSEEEDSESEDYQGPSPEYFAGGQLDYAWIVQHLSFLDKEGFIEIPLVCEICKINSIQGVLSRNHPDGSPNYYMFVCEACGQKELKPVLEEERDCDTIEDEYFPEMHKDTKQLAMYAKFFDPKRRGMFG